jgi:exportin-2 (importin alpha re-exporter)
MKLFYNLNYQDLHPKFEDDLPFWMSVLKAVMKLPNSNEMVFKCKGAALEAILLYANKYKEDVEQSIRDFCVEIWPMCANASEDPEYDPIVFNCLKFFKSLLNWSDMKGFFLSNIDQFFENLILPNIGLTKTALGQFEDEPEIFIDYYFRNSEMMTRRAAAIELLRIICRSYGSAFPAFAQKHLSSFMSLPSKNAADECTILGLIIDGSSKGFRDVDGCTQLFVEENIIHFCYNNIVKSTLGAVFTWAIANPQRVVEDQFNPLHVAIILRFLFYFRIYFPKQELASILQCISKLRSKRASLRRAIQITISGYIIIKHGDYETYRNLTPFFTPDNLRPLAVDILTLIYQTTVEEDFLQ